MYKIKYYDDYIFIPGDEEFKVISPKLARETNKADKLTLTILDNHPSYGEIKKLKLGVSILDGDKVIFKGRTIDTDESFDKSIFFTIEGKLAVLNDSLCRPHNFQGTPAELFKWFIENHNANVGNEQKLKVGKISVTDSNNYIARSWEKTEKTLSLINSRLIDKLGGFLVIRYEEDGDYIDWLADAEDVSTQKIEFGENLLDLNMFIDATSTYTACIPYGAEDENGNRLTVESVNSGNDYIVNQELALEYGIIYAPTEKTTWEDVTIPENLLNKATDWLYQQGIMFNSTVELSFIDLNKLGIDVGSIKMFQKVQVASKPHNIETMFTVNTMTQSLDDIEDVKITVGKTVKTLTDSTLGDKRKNDETLQRVEVMEKNNKDYVTNEAVKEEINNALDRPNAEIEEIKSSIDKTNQSIDDIQTSVNRELKSLETNIEQSSSQIVLEAQATYATKDELTATKSKLEILSNQVGISVETIEKIISTFDFTELGLIIGKSDSEIKSVQDNDSYAFVDKSGTKILELDTKGVNAPSVNISKQLKIGDGWAIRQGEYVSGKGYNLNDVWIGG